MSFRLGLLDALNIELERTDELGSAFARAIGRCLESLKSRRGPCHVWTYAR
jgi:hypothetical protein